MSVSLLAQSRPPMVEFSWREMEDRNASLEAGRFVARQVAHVTITPLGDNGKTRVYRGAEEWLEDLQRQVKADMYPPEWARKMNDAYQAWLAGEEMPLSGTPIKGWAILSAAESRHVIDGGIRTVEDLAELPDGAIGERGMGWLSWREKARNWIAAASSVGSVAARVTAAEAENADLKRQMEEMLATMRQMSAQLQEQESAPKRGRSKRAEPVSDEPEFLNSLEA